VDSPPFVSNHITHPKQPRLGKLPVSAAAQCKLRLLNAHRRFGGSNLGHKRCLVARIGGELRLLEGGDL
jgi:hypothetical protein